MPESVTHGHITVFFNRNSFNMPVTKQISSLCIFLILLAAHINLCRAEEGNPANHHLINKSCTVHECHTEASARDSEQKDQKHDICGDDLLLSSCNTASQTHFTMPVCTVQDFLFHQFTPDTQNHFHYSLFNSSQYLSPVNSSTVLRI
jgi:hypothetical protein